MTLIEKVTVYKFKCGNCGSKITIEDYKNGEFLGKFICSHCRNYEVEWFSVKSYVRTSKISITRLRELIREGDFPINCSTFSTKQIYEIIEKHDLGVSEVVTWIQKRLGSLNRNTILLRDIENLENHFKKKWRKN